MQLLRSRAIAIVERFCRVAPAFPPDIVGTAGRELPEMAGTPLFH